METSKENVIDISRESVPTILHDHQTKTKTTFYLRKRERQGNDNSNLFMSYVKTMSK